MKTGNASVKNRRTNSQASQRALITPPLQPLGLPSLWRQCAHEAPPDGSAQEQDSTTELAAGRRTRQPPAKRTKAPDTHTAVARRFVGAAVAVTHGAAERDHHAANAAEVQGMVWRGPWLCAGQRHRTTSTNADHQRASTDDPNCHVQPRSPRNAAMQICSSWPNCANTPHIATSSAGER